MSRFRVDLMFVRALAPVYQTRTADLLPQAVAVDHTAQIPEASNVPIKTPLLSNRRDGATNPSAASVTIFTNRDLKMFRARGCVKKTIFRSGPH